MIKSELVDEHGSSLIQYVQISALPYIRIKLVGHTLFELEVGLSFISCNCGTYT